VSEGHICCCLICIPGWWGNSSLGLPLTADPNPSQTAGQPCFHYPTTNPTLLSRNWHIYNKWINLKKLSLNALCVSYARGETWKAESGDYIAGLRERRTCIVPQLLPGSCLLPVWTEGPSICRWLICSVYRGAKGGPRAHEEGWKEAAYVSPQEPGGKACPTRATT